jgi:hypothetical protein
MHVAVVLGMGAVPGALGASGIFFDRRTEAKGYFVVAGTIRGGLVALLVTSTSPAASGLIAGASLGALYGGRHCIDGDSLTSEECEKACEYILPPSIVSGALIGVLAWGFDSQ